MANRVTSSPRVNLLLMMLVLMFGAAAATSVTGCASNPELVENLPAPSFNGPAIAPQPAKPLPPAPRPTAQAQARRAQPTPTMSAGGGVPREWIPVSGRRDWRYIVIHHSATPAGSARSFDDMHRDKGWDELGYHFVIGNGTDSGDGEVEVGPRWPKQKWGAHAKTPDNLFNEYGIGICLVGNFDLERPTPQQSKSLARLVGHLMKTYHIPSERVIGHRDTKPTECPGRNMNIAALRRQAAQLADSGEGASDAAPVAGALDLLEPIAPHAPSPDVSGSALADPGHE
jgi:hypothetical protein